MDLFALVHRKKKKITQFFSLISLFKTKQQYKDTKHLNIIANCTEIHKAEKCEKKYTNLEKLHMAERQM